ncbi:MAG: class I mannose-6-phosphate isomerase [Ruminococcaceae bacterium]|nr:class I mannose-6-phosphate isomerase [Oscillospiraceae bacterium]
MYPIKLNPVFKEIVWGGERLKSDYGYESDLNNIAEAWVLTARNDGDNTVKNGEYSGQSFTELIKNNPQFLGKKGEKYNEFPLLIKFIDAKSDLSIQVHPDDDYARKHENSLGKTEAWYVLDCSEDAELIYGFNKEISKEEFESSIKDNSFLNYVNKVKVKKGDIFFIEAGTLHAIGGGILLAEVQQNCNTTYRVYDYGRLVDGKPRELHIKKALDVTNTLPPTRSAEAEGNVENIEDAKIQKLCSCEFFTMTSLELNGKYNYNCSNDSFLSVLILEGRGSITVDNTAVSVKKGDSIFIPANSGNVLLSGEFNALLSTL